MSFVNKVVLITGAASGIGEAIAVKFAKESVILSLLDVNLDNLNKVTEKCKSLSNKSVLSTVVDVTIDEDLKSAVDSTVAEYGRIDVLVNCAGIFLGGKLLSNKTLDAYDKVINVNLRAIVAIIHYAANALINSKGCIINISSILGKIVTPERTVYSVSKAAVTHLTKCVALELAEKGVRVNCILPGAVKTNIFGQHVTNNERSTLDDFIDASPLKRCAEPEEIAELAAYLASDKAISITGAEFIVDNGLALTTSFEL